VLDKNYLDKQCFWTRDKKGSTAEVDFVYQTQGKIIPIEVKSGANSHLRSLQSFMKTEGASMLGVRVWPGAFSVDDVNVQPDTFSVDSVKVSETQSTYRLVNVPFYLVGQLDKIINRLL
jgi:hypothetical protein